MTFAWFDHDVSAATVGGKGFNLCRLAQAGLPVLPGFCIPVEDLNRISRHDVDAALARLGAAAVAVRSSAVQEDSTAASFAGVYPTRLHVVGAQAVIDALTEIRDSALAQESVAYRRARGVTHSPGMAAVVQEFLSADASGVLFTRDPVDGSDRVVVEGSWGLGEAVVAGIVTPDRWLLRPDGALISTCIAEKDVAVVPGEVGTKVVPVDSERQTAPCLDAASLRRLVELARACGQLFGAPQDIEWAVASNRVWLMQSRPITQNQRLRK